MWCGATVPPILEARGLGQSPPSSASVVAVTTRGLIPSVRLAVVLGLVAFGACNGKGFGNVSKEDAPKTVSDEICDQADACDCFEGTVLDVDLCKMQYQSQWQMMIEAADAAGLTYDGNCVGWMLDAYTDLGCRTSIDPEEFGLDECSQCKFFHGDKQAGQPCTPPDNPLLALADECAQGLYCNGEVCVDPCSKAGEGQSCEYSGCQDGLVCVFEYDPETGESSAICVRPAGEGEDCLDTACAEGLWCQSGYDPETQAETATCIKPAQQGEDCSEKPCGEDLQCDYESYTCVPAPADPGPGEPCMGYCAEGAWCDTSDPDPTNWVCQVQKGDGEPCDSDQECITYDCEDGACVPEQPIVCF